MKITLIHLSDLQFGRHHADDNRGRAPIYDGSSYDAESQKMIRDFDILKKYNVKPEYVVSSGDISETSAMDEYALATDFLNKILSYHSIDKKKVVLVPGNHDVNWMLCEAARLRAKAMKNEFKPPFFEKFEFYKNYFDNFYSEIQWDITDKVYSFEKDKLYNLFLFEDKNLAFIGLNSCIDESEEAPHYGNITVEQCTNAFEELNTIDRDGEFKRIVVMHHNFVRSSTNDEENLKDADELLPILIKNNVALILHGHQHVTKSHHIGIGGRSIPVLGSGSAGLDGDTLPENCRRYQVVEIENNTIRVFKRRFDSEQVYMDGKGCWTSDMSPDEDKVFYEIPATLPHKNKNENERKANYDLYKIHSTRNALRGIDILNLAYPRRKIDLVDRVLDHKSRIYYEYLALTVELNTRLYFLFVGKNISQKSTILHFLKNNKFPQNGLTICTPRVFSKGDGDSEFRAKNIKQVMVDNKIPESVLSVHFIDDYVWENCLDLSLKSKKSLVPELPYYIDQNIYKFQNNEELNLGLSLKFFEDFFNTQYEEKNDFYPISVILASGGMGKSTLCDKLSNMVNKYDKKKTIYINAEDIKDKLSSINYEVNTITDLFCIYDTVNGSQQSCLHDPNNLEINISCGNIIVIIDGLDEIESSLMDRFDFDLFLNSILGMDNYFNNCQIIITSRDYHKDKYINKEGVAVFFLKGFERNNVEQYFEKRFPGDKHKITKSLEYVNKLNINEESFYIPLFLQLIADIVQRESSGEKLQDKRYLNTDILKTEFVLDDLIVRLIDREIDKQKLGISIDEFIELLNEIAVKNSDNVTLTNFHEYIDICLPKTTESESNEETHIKYHINPLIEISDSKVRLKYDAVSLLIKSRFIQNSFEKGQYCREIIPLLAENYYGSGSIIEELLLPNNANSISIHSLSEAIKFLKGCINAKIGIKAKELIQKAISFLLYLAFKIETPYDKKERSELLAKLYNNDLRNIYIYGDFYPLNFIGLRIFDSKFSGFNSLFFSDFSKDEKVFFYCSFIDLDIIKSKIIPKTVFDDTCNIPLELRNYFTASKEIAKKHYLLIKSDLKKFFKSFVVSNVFNERSMNLINSTYMTKFNRRTFIKEMSSKYIISSRTHKGNFHYFIADEYQPSVLSLINQNNLDPLLEDFCNHLMSKYYKI